MSINKVIFGDETLIDLTSDTVKPSLLMSGVTAHDCTGTSITGTIIARTSSDIEVAGPTVSVPSGAYSSAATKAVATGAYYSQFDLNINQLNIQLNNTTGKININQNSSLNTTVIKTTGYIEKENSVGHFNASVSSSYQLPTIPAATITPTESSQVAAASGKFTLGNITVAAVSSDYIGSNIAQRSSSDITVTGPTVSVPAGYYAATASKAIAAGSMWSESWIQPNVQMNFNSTTGVVTAAFNDSMLVSPVRSAGYLKPEYNYIVGAIGNSSYALTTRGSADVSISGQVVSVSSGYYATNNSVTIPSAEITDRLVLRVDPSIKFNSTTGVVTAEYDQEYLYWLVSESGYVAQMTGYYNPWGVSTYQIPTKSAATYTPSTAAQTIASGQYLIGAQTISGDTNLVAANIASGVSIFGVIGTHIGGITPTGTISISSNGTYDVTNYAAASVNIGATVVEKRLIVPEGMIGV